MPNRALKTHFGQSNRNLYPKSKESDDMKNKGGQLSYIRTKLLTALHGNSKFNTDNKTAKLNSANNTRHRNNSIDKVRK